MSYELKSIAHNPSFITHNSSFISPIFFSISLPRLMDSFSWREAKKNKSYILSLFLTLTVLSLIAVYAGGYFDFIELRNGPKLNDFIFKFLPAHDVSWVVFLFLYSGVGIGLFSLR